MPRRRSAGVDSFLRGLLPALADGQVRFVVSMEARDLRELGRELKVEATLRRARTVQLGDLRLVIGAVPAGVLLDRTPLVLWPMTVGDLSGATAIHQPRSPLRGRARRWLDATAVERAVASVFSSNWAHQAWASEYTRLSNIPHSVIPYGVDEAFASSSARRESPILWVSHVYPYKRLDRAVGGYASFLSRLRPASVVPPLIVAGRIDDEAADAIRRLAQQLGILEHVELLGSVGYQSLLDLYQESGTFLFTSAMEIAGSFALLDALRHGLPTVCSDRSSMPELCGDSVLYCDPDSAASIGEALLHLWCAPAVRRRLAHAARERALAIGGWDRAVGELAFFLGELADGLG